MIETPSAPPKPKTTNQPPTTSNQPLSPQSSVLVTPSWWLGVVGLAVCAAVLLLLEKYIGVYMPDDAYITYRYAENLASGNGLVFNAAAPPVEGYSNLSWIILLAGLSKLGLNLPVWAANVGAALSVLNLLLVYALSLQVVKHRGWALVAPALVALTAPYAIWARGGLETMWYATMLLLAVWLTVLGLEGKLWAYPLAVDALFLLALTRHDGAIPLALSGLFVLASLVGMRFWDRSRGVSLSRWLVPAASFAVLGVVFLAYTWWRGQYFGQLVPAPFFSRLGGTISDPSLLSVTWGSYFTRGSHYSAYGDLLVPTFALAAADLVWFRRAKLRDWYILSCACALSLLYFISESYNPGIRYMVPVLPLLYLYAQGPIIALIKLVARTAGLPTTGSWASPNSDRLPTTWRRWLAVGGVCAAIAIFLLVMLPRTRYDSKRAEDAKNQALVPLGQWLGKYAPPNSTVALQDIGVVAYYSGLRVIDDNPGALTNGDLIYKRGKQGFSDIALGPRPEFLVFTCSSDRYPLFYNEFELLKQDPRFTQGYKLYNKVKYWEDRGYWVYVRKDVQLSPGAAQAFPQTAWYETPAK
jgi:arabinofuranosyltransferase